MGRSRGSLEGWATPLCPLLPLRRLPQHSGTCPRSRADEAGASFFNAEQFGAVIARAARAAAALFLGGAGGSWAFSLPQPEPARGLGQGRACDDFDVGDFSARRPGRARARSGGLCRWMAGATAPSEGQAAGARGSGRAGERIRGMRLERGDVSAARCARGGARGRAAEVPEFS